MRHELPFPEPSRGNQPVHCGSADTSVDIPTPNPETDIARALVLETTFSGMSQLIELRHALASEHKTHVYLANQLHSL